MTRLTQDHKKEIEKNSDRQILKDIRLNKWFTGKDIEDDVTTLEEFFKDIN